MHAARCSPGALQRPAPARIAPSTGRAIARIGSSNDRRAASVRAAAATTTTTTSAAPAAGAPPASEAAARAAFEASGPNTQERCLSVLREAVRKRSTPPEQVEGALSLLEKLAKQGGGGAGDASPSPSPSPSPPPEASVLGTTWWLVFSTATSVRAFQYIPVRELFRVGRERVALDSRVGPVRFVISGPTAAAAAASSSSSSSPYDPSTGTLAFTFTQVAAYWSPFSGDAEIPQGQAPFWSTQIKTPKPKSYTFYFAEDKAGGVAAARSSAGGLAALTRVPERQD